MNIFLLRNSYLSINFNFSNSLTDNEKTNWNFSAIEILLFFLFKLHIFLIHSYVYSIFEISYLWNLMLYPSYLMMLLSHKFSLKLAFLKLYLFVVNFFLVYIFPQILISYLRRLIQIKFMNILLNRIIKWVTNLMAQISWFLCSWFLFSWFYFHFYFSFLFFIFIFHLHPKDPDHLMV